MWCLVIFKQCLKGFVSKPELESAPAWLAPTGLLPHTLGVTGQRANQSSCVMVDILLDSLFHSKHHWYTNQTINSSAKVICQSRVWVHVKFSNTKLAAIFLREFCLISQDTWWVQIATREAVFGKHDQETMFSQGCELQTKFGFVPTKLKHSLQSQI